MRHVTFLVPPLMLVGHYPTLVGAVPTPREPTMDSDKLLAANAVVPEAMVRSAVDLAVCYGYDRSDGCHVCQRHQESGKKFYHLDVAGKKLWGTACDHPTCAWCLYCGRAPPTPFYNPIVTTWAPTEAPTEAPIAPAITVRLVNGANHMQGRVEVWHSGSWGTVCGDRWTNADAQVVYRQLDIEGAGTATAFQGGHFAAGSGSIHYDDVDCHGSEDSLDSCSSAPHGTHNCAHNEDDGADCGGTAAPTDAPTRPPPVCQIKIADHLVTCTGFNEVYDSGRKDSFYAACDTAVSVKGDCASVVIYDNDSEYWSRIDDLHADPVHSATWHASRFHMTFRVIVQGTKSKQVTNLLVVTEDVQKCNT